MLLIQILQEIPEQDFFLGGFIVSATRKKQQLTREPAILVSDETNLRQEETLMSCYHHLSIEERESLMLFLDLELSSQVQRYIEENLIGRFPTEAFAGTSI